jgi:hypothetical protein
MDMELTRRDFLRLSGLAGLTALTAGAIDLGNAAAQDRNQPELLDPYKGLTNLTGDIHVHTSFSDGDESPDFGLRYARDISRLDFCCITDHAEIMTDDGLKCLAYYQSLPSKYDEPGRFSVLYGFEWTGYHFGNAHRCVYTLDNSIPILPSNKPEYWEVDGLWKALAGYDCIVIPHCVVREQTSNWWDRSDPNIEPVVEFYSKWGSSLGGPVERPVCKSSDVCTVYKAFSAGKRYGLICNSDTHFTRPGSNLQEVRPEALLYPKAGLTGVWATSHTREAIYDALKNRRCYGMTGTKVNIQFSVNDAIMGSEIKSTASPVIKYSASSETNFAAATIAKITKGIIENLDITYGDNKAMQGIFTDDKFTSDAGYFLRFDMAGGDWAVTSPIWVSKG